MSSSVKLVEVNSLKPFQNETYCFLRSCGDSWATARWSFENIEIIPLVRHNYLDWSPSYKTNNQISSSHTWFNVYGNTRRRSKNLYRNIIGDKMTSPYTFTNMAEETDEFERELSSEEQSEYYTLLNVPRNASSDEIRAAYRRLCRIYHPDR